MKKILTGNPSNHKFYTRHIFYAPLLFEATTNNNEWCSRSEQILYFGRLDTEKYFDQFSKLKISKKIVATSNLNISTYQDSVGPISTQSKIDLFQSQKYVWCVQRNFLSQSAVVIDAVRFGCVCLLADSDPVTRYLDPSFYILIPPIFDEQIISSLVDEYLNKFPTGPCLDPDLQSKFYGQIAFDNHWAPHI